MAEVYHITAPEDEVLNPVEIKKEKKSFAPMRIGLLILFLMLIIGGTYLVYHAFRRVTNRNTDTVQTSISPLSSLVAATVNPTPGTNRPQVISQSNTAELSNSNSSTDGRAIGSNVKNQDSGDYPCPDALGDTVACLPPWYKP